MSADTVSSLFPDRPIRPLPKRRLRERLSPDVADSIQYPPAPQTTTPLFYYPYSSRDEDSESAGHLSRDRPTEARVHHGRRNGLGPDSDEDEAGLRRNFLSQPVSDLLGRSARMALKQEQARHTNLQPPLSAASSADGYYDPFEITNNKKKRKIPTAGDAAMSGSHSVHDIMHSADQPGTPTPSVEGHGDNSPAMSSGYYASGGFASGGSHNVSGPGRGRYGRVRNGRSPLRALSDSSGNWAGRNGKLRPSQWASPSSENTGIISNAIAKAEKISSEQGQENLNLLQQQQSAKADPATTQFTFTCDSQVPGAVAWPGTGRRSNVAAAHHKATTKATVSRFSTGSSAPQNMDDPANSGTAKLASQGQPQPPTMAAQPKKTRRRATKELELAAKVRRQQTLYENRHNPPKPEDVWICEFCEYESIFRRPPEALIRQYENKDRKLRLQEAERRRLLEKAKSRSRKGKKGTKVAGVAKNTTSAQDRTTPQGETSAPPPAQAHIQGTESEDYYDEEGEGEAELPEDTGEHGELPEDTGVEGHSGRYGREGGGPGGTRRGGGGGGAAAKGKEVDKTEGEPTALVTTPVSGVQLPVPNPAPAPTFTSPHFRPGFVQRPLEY